MDEIDVPIANHWRIDKWYPELSEEARRKMRSFYDELLKFNKSVNLISNKTVPQADAIYFADCILGARLIFDSVPNLGELYDLGSGNGFPGIVFGIMYSNLKIKLVEQDLRKCDFLKHVVDFLGLRNVTVLSTSIEALPESSIKYCVSRSLGSISKSIFITRKIVASGGVYFHFKGEGWAQEVTEIPSQLCSYWAPSLLAEYKLPVGNIKFAVIRVDKIRQ